MEEKKLSTLKAIRAKCLDCCCGSSNEVKLCTIEHCALYPYRFGKNPYRREMTPEEKEKCIANLRGNAAENRGQNLETDLGV